MQPEEKARQLGINLDPQTPGYLNLCSRSGNQLITSGHVSDLKGVLGKNLGVDEGYAAAKDCAQKILRSVYNSHGTLNGLRVIKVLGCCHSAYPGNEMNTVIETVSGLYAV